jgi:hypothetical protein
MSDIPDSIIEKIFQQSPAIMTHRPGQKEVSVKIWLTGNNSHMNSLLASIPRNQIKEAINKIVNYEITHPHYWFSKFKNSELQYLIYKVATFGALSTSIYNNNG